MIALLNHNSTGEGENNSMFHKNKDSQHIILSYTQTGGRQMQSGVQMANMSTLRLGSMTPSLCSN
jgi:hypothetical protein